MATNSSKADAVSQSRPNRLGMMYRDLSPSLISSQGIHTLQKLNAERSPCMGRAAGIEAMFHNRRQHSLNVVDHDMIPASDQCPCPGSSN